MLPEIILVIYSICSFFVIIKYIDKVNNLEKERSSLLDQVVKHQITIKDLERDLKETKIERNVFRDFVDEFLNNDEEIEEVIDE